MATKTKAVRPNKTRRVSQASRRFYREDNRANIPLRYFLETDRDYPYRSADGRIDCNLVSAAIKRFPGQVLLRQLFGYRPFLQALQCKGFFILNAALTRNTNPQPMVVKITQRVLKKIDQ